MSNFVIGQSSIEYRVSSISKFLLSALVCLCFRLGVTQVPAQPTVTIAVDHHVLKLDYNASIQAPGASHMGTDCAPVTATATVSNLGNWVVQSYNWVNSGSTPPASLEPGNVWFNQWGTTATASGYSFATGNTYTRVTCAVTFLNSQSQQQITITPGGDWVVTIGGQLAVSQQPSTSLSNPYYVAPGYVRDLAPLPNANIQLHPVYIEYFGPNNVPNYTNNNPSLPEYAQWPAIGEVSINQADVATPGYSGVTVTISSSGPVKLYNQTGGPDLTCKVVATGASSSNGDIVPSAIFNIDIEDPDHPGHAITGTCTDCDQDEPNKDAFSFTAHSPSTVNFIVSGGLVCSRPGGWYQVFRADTMEVIDPLANLAAYPGNEVGGMPKVLVNEEWSNVHLPTGDTLGTNPAGGPNWLSLKNGPTTGDGEFVDNFDYADPPDQYDPYNNGMNPALANGLQTYWAGTWGIDGNSGGLRMTSWFNQFWSDFILRTEQ